MLVKENLQSKVSDQRKKIYLRLTAKYAVVLSTDYRKKDLNAFFTSS